MLALVRNPTQPNDLCADASRSGSPHLGTRAQQMRSFDGPLAAQMTLNSGASDARESDEHLCRSLICIRP
jgi:hypothetical protein